LVRAGQHEPSSFLPIEEITMVSRRMLNLVAAAVVFAGGSYLAQPAEAAGFACSESQWSLALARASAACGGGGASIVAECTNSRLIVQEIYCY
jgi:hypothetical protein